MSTMEAGQVPETGAIRLPPPEKVGGIPLMQALKGTAFVARIRWQGVAVAVAVEPAVGGENGVNRAGTGQRTAPSARDGARPMCS